MSDYVPLTDAQLACILAIASEFELNSTAYLPDDKTDIAADYLRRLVAEVRERRAAPRIEYIGYWNTNEYYQDEPEEDEP